MDVIEALTSRHSVRVFRPDPIAKETLLKILDTANHAPSWANSQPWQTIIASGQPLERLRKGFLDRFDAGNKSQPDVPRLAALSTALASQMKDFGGRLAAAASPSNGVEERQRRARSNYAFFGAPAVLYLCAELADHWSFFDLGMYAQSAMLAAHQLGVGSIPAISLVAYPDLLRQELEVPDNQQIILGLALGYPVADHPLNLFRSGRRPAEEASRLMGV